MRFIPIILTALVLTTACSAQSSPVDSASVEIAQVETPPVPSLKTAAPQAPEESSETSPARTVSEKSPADLPQDPRPIPLRCTGIAQQGGLVTCRTFPGAKVKIGRSASDFYYESANDDGMIIVGFDRDETKTTIQAMPSKANKFQQRIPLAPSRVVSLTLPKRAYDISRIDGLPPSQVSTFSAAQLTRIRASSARKKTGFASRSKTVGFRDGFSLPVANYTKTTNFGAQRILNGERKKPHYGVDMAAPVGTPILAPADGIVSLSDDDLYFEGAMVLLDHGQGLISMYLHVNEIMVEPGQVVKRGEQIATVGSKGRSTGPHLCWRLKWRNRNLDPELISKWSERAQDIK